MAKYIEPLWCEDCAYFQTLGMDGEGKCNAPKPKYDVWYGRPACAAIVELREGERGNDDKTE